MFCGSGAVFKLLLLVLCVNNARCKMCHSMDIRNDVSNLNKLRNCTEIAGHLKILLIEKVRGEHEFDKYVFPELTKITGFLFFYQVLHLTSIGKIFPNLMVIRGVELFTDYALVVYNMPHIREIGTSKLLFIARGFVQIDKSPNLCFVDTVDWHKIGAAGIHFTNVNNKTCPACPRNCNGYCWNTDHCQNMATDKCHKECLGCSEDFSANHCYACKNFDDHGTCVAKCPVDKYVHRTSYRCLTKEECSQLPKGPWWVFRDQCVDSCPPKYQIAKELKTPRCELCDENCTKYCEQAEPIENLDRLQKLKGCTHINGSISIRFASVAVKVEEKLIEEFEENLGSIRYIRDYLIIKRTRSLKSLDFLKNLKAIGGENLSNNRYAMLFYENQNLQKLWDFDNKNFSLEIRKGTIAFHNNPQLCQSEIEKLAMISKLTYTALDVDEYSNGDKSLCNFIDLNITKLEVSSKNVTMAWRQDTVPNDDSLVGYVVNYGESNGQNISIETHDTCDSKGWHSVYVMNNSTSLVNLTPFTNYAFYIKIYSNNNDKKVIVQSRVMYFTTLPDHPDSPDIFEASPVDSQTISLSWSKPYPINGVLNRYVVYVYQERDRADFVSQRDYCLYPRSIEADRYKTETTTEKPITLNNVSEFGCCSCQTHTEDLNIFKLDNFLRLCDQDAMSKYGFDMCRNYYYSTINDDMDKISLNKRSQIMSSSVKKSQRYLNVTDSSITIQPNVTSYIVKNLKHYTMYVFYMQACNENYNGVEMCSGVRQAWARTKKKLEADDVEHVEIVVEESNVTITWSEPKDPNSIIVYYTVEYIRPDSEHSKSVAYCITRESYLQEKKYILYNLTPGKYSFRVQSGSLAGPGRFTPYHIVIITSPVSSSLLWSLSMFFMLFVIVLGVGGYLYYKKKQNIDNIHLITNINPDYAGPIYVEDDWEVERDDIELHKDLGQGTFGAVYYGTIKSKKIPCAVKTVYETATIHDRMEFLNEACVMKAFSNTHHVVKLLGVVSRGQPPLVIMELMERGDLKKYLRKMRDSSQNITCNEIYRMAIEIADGMTYLAAKKFVHRDLAARNCMVAQDRTVKIGDFGMARDIYETDYYRKETKGLLPVRWMAPESLADGVFTSDSDVWSYGIVLWEIATLAEQPYQGLANEQVLQFVVSKGRLQRPPECPDLLFEIMSACWQWRPSSRPTFSDIVDKLENHVGQDFKLVSWYHSREGHEARLTNRERTYNAPALEIGTGEGPYGRYSAADEEVRLYAGESERPKFTIADLVNG